MPNWKKVIVSGSDAVLNEITASGGILTSQDIMPDADNTLSLGSSTQRFQLNGGTPVTVTGSGTANTITRFNGATEVENSTITNTDLVTTIVHDNDGNDIFIVSGSNGELIKVTDTISDTLFQVNDGSGIAKLEVSSSGLTTTNDVSIDGWGSVSASLSTIQTSIDSVMTPIQLVVDTKLQSSGYVAWFAVSDIQSNPDRAFTTWIAPSDGYLDEVIVSPEQANTTTANLRISLVVDGTTQGSTVSVAMGAAGTNKTFTFGSTNYSFTAGERLSLSFDKLTNTADLYNVMVKFRLDN